MKCCLTILVVAMHLFFSIQAMNRRNLKKFYISLSNVACNIRHYRNTSSDNLTKEEQKLQARQQIRILKQTKSPIKYIIPLQCGTSYIGTYNNHWFVVPDESLAQPKKK